MVIRTLKYGYEPVFTSKPNSYFETNNKSARDNLLFFQDEVVKLLNNNIILITIRLVMCLISITTTE